ncbi:MAG: HAMP domain-containing sensor histidine kinase [Acidimicrobiia bacterium]
MSSVNDPTPLAGERVLVWLIAAFSAATAILYLLAGWSTGESRFVAGAIGPAVVCGIAVVAARFGEGRLLPVIVATSVVILAETQIVGIQEFADIAAVPLAVLAVGGAFFVPGRWVVPYVAGYGVAMFVSRYHWANDDTALVAATIAAGTVILGALLVAWVRRGFDQREERFQSLFTHAPISMWQEDFSGVGNALNALSNEGVEDLAAYFGENPEEVRRIASLVRVLDVNDAALRLTEAPNRSVLIGSLPMDTFSRGALESFIPQFLAIVNDLDTATTDLHGGLTVTGRPIEALLVWSAPRLDGALDLTNVTVAIVDITRQRDAERKLEDLLATKDQLVATISHEIRTPLTAVVGIAEELRNPRTTISESEREELLGLVADQSVEVSRIVEDLLVVARTDAGNLVVEPQPINLGEETRQVVRAIDRAIPLEVESTETVVADPQRVRQIVRNLITNARRYGGPSIRIVVRQHGSSSTVEVRDNGEALDRDSRTAVFEPYGRAQEGERLSASVGLGLTVSRRLARHMGGDLTYDHDGQEAIFTLTLATASRPVPVP